MHSHEIIPEIQSWEETRQVQSCENSKLLLVQGKGRSLLVTCTGDFSKEGVNNT